MRRAPWAEPRVQVIRVVLCAICPGPFINRRGKYRELSLSRRLRPEALTEHFLQAPQNYENSSRRPASSADGL